MPDAITKIVGLGGIGVKAERLRALRPDTVKGLMESMTENGLINPITLRPKSSAATGYWLVAGRHRLEAARKLDWDSIEAKIFDGMDADHAELAEIDENLIRADLSPAERALHVDARKTLYENLHPETKSTKEGGPGRAKRTQSHDATESDEPADAFIDDTAKKTGKHRSTVARESKRGREGKGWLKDVAGTSLDQPGEIDALIDLPDADRAQLIAKAAAGEKASAKTRLKQLNREKREQELGAKIVALPEKKYGVILADPEWRFEPWSRETGMSRAADNHYPTSCTEVIAARDVPSIAAKDCVLFLCATAPMLLHAAVVMAAWGFDYVTNWELHKDRVITGYWNRNRHEHLLLGIRGNVPCPAPGEQWESVIEMTVGRHSEKPGAIYEMIEAYFPNLPKIELNCRGLPRPGWDGWGNEVVEAAE